MAFGLIRWIQIGMTEEELVKKENLQDLIGYECQGVDVVGFVKRVIQTQKKNICFGVQTRSRVSGLWGNFPPDPSSLYEAGGYVDDYQPVYRILALNAEWEDWEIYFRRDESDAAIEACEGFNKIVRKLYGIRKKLPKPTLTQKEFVKKNGLCPCCETTSLIVLDCRRRSRPLIVGCRACGATWKANYWPEVRGRFCLVTQCGTRKGDIGAVPVR